MDINEKKYFRWLEFHVLMYKYEEKKIYVRYVDIYTNRRSFKIMLMIFLFKYFYVWKT